MGAVPPRQLAGHLPDLLAPLRHLNMLSVRISCLAANASRQHPAGFICTLESVSVELTPFLKHGLSSGGLIVAGVLHDSKAPFRRKEEFKEAQTIQKEGKDAQYHHEKFRRDGLSM